MENRQADTAEQALLWARFKEGDQEAFSKIYFAWYPTLYNYAYNLFADRDFVKDTLQDFFVDLWEGRQKLANVQSVKFYLIVSVRRKMLYNLKKHRREPLFGLPEDYELTGTASHESDLILAESEQQTHFSLISELNRLPLRQKEAVYLKYFQELTYPQIVDVMQLQYQTVRDLIYKGIKTLRAKLRNRLFW